MFFLPLQFCFLHLKQIHLVVCRSAGPISHNLPLSNHLTQGEESEDLGGNNTYRSHLLRRDIAHAADNAGRLRDDLAGGGFGLLAGLLEHLSGADAAEHGLEVGLESSDVTIKSLLVWSPFLGTNWKKHWDGWLTEGSFCVPGQRIC